MTTTLKQLADTGLIDGHKVIAWGLNNEGYEAAKADHEARKSRIDELRQKVGDTHREWALQLSGAQEKYRKESKEYKEALRFWKAQSKLHEAQHRKHMKGKAPNPGVFNIQQPVEPALIRPDYDDTEEKELAMLQTVHKLRGTPDKSYDGGIHIKRLAALAPEALCDYNPESKMVRVLVTKNGARGRYLFHVGKTVEASSFTDTWKPDRFIGQPLKKEIFEEVGAAESDGKYIWRTDGHRYIFTNEAPEPGKYDIGKQLAKNLRDIPHPDRVISVFSEDKVAAVLFTIRAGDFAKAIVQAASNSDEFSVHIVAQRGSAGVEILVRGCDSRGSSSSELSLSSASLEYMHDDCRDEERFLFNSDYLTASVKSFGPKALLEVVILAEHHAQYGTIYMEEAETTVHRGVALMGMKDYKR